MYIYYILKIKLNKRMEFQLNTESFKQIAFFGQTHCSFTPLKTLVATSLITVLRDFIALAMHDNHALLARQTISLLLFPEFFDHFLSYLFVASSITGLAPRFI